jgi:anti-sigma factor RsiW
MNHDDANPCRRLDAYIDGELSREIRGLFVAHLDQCSACREAIDQQRWIDSVLTSAAAAELESAPPLREMRRRRPSRRRWLPLAAAAAVAALVALPLLTPRRSDVPGAGPLSALPSAPTLSSNEGAVSLAPAPPILIETPPARISAGMAEVM